MWSVVLVGRAGSGSFAGDLASAVMRPGQGRAQCDSGAGELCTRGVRTGERRSEGDGGAAPAEAEGGDNRLLLVCTAVNGDVLPVIKPNWAGDGDNGRAHAGG